MKVIENIDAERFTMTFMCPACGQFLMYSKSEHCPHCGEKLEWINNKKHDEGKVENV